MSAPLSMGQFIKDLERMGQLRRIKDEVDPYLEVTALTDPVMKRTGPALLFENVKGAKRPIAINLYGSRQRMAHALGAARIEDIGERIRAMMEMEIPDGLWAKVKSAIPKLKQLAAFKAKEIKNAPCQQVVLEGEAASLDILPILTCWPEDGGPFITLPQVITADPETGRQNIGMYRMQKYDAHTTGMHWHRHKGGAAHYNKAKRLGVKLPVAVAIGGPPITTYTACAPLPEAVDELMFSGFLLQSPLQVTKAVSSDLLVPAEAEVVIEGYVDPAEPWRTEGPFGDHTGFYSLADEYPVFHVTHITHRKDFIYPCTIVGRPPMEDFYLGLATERIFLPLMQAVAPEVVDYHMPAEGVFHNLVFVAIDKQYPGHAFKVMNTLWGTGQMMFAKVLVIVDKHVNVQDPQEAWWEALNNIDPKRDMLFTKGPADALDHAAQLPWLHSKVGIDGTRKTPDEGFHRPWPGRVEMTPDVQKAAMDKLKKWGLV